MRRAIRRVKAGFSVAKASEQFRQSDVTIWGIVALVCAGLAVFGSNVALLMPQGLMSGLHQPRFAGASMDGLRQQMAGLRQEVTRLTNENELLLSRFALQEKSGSEITRRVGALEVTVPRMLEDMPETQRIDMANTASVGEDLQSFETEGGSVAIRQTALPQLSPRQQPLPPPVEPMPVTVSGDNAYGVALGTNVGSDDAPALWDEISVKIGPLLFDLDPLLSTDPADGQSHIIVGPFAEMSEASTLCERVERVSIACTPTAYEGVRLAGLSTAP